MKNLRLLILLGTFVLTLATSVLAQNPNCEVFPGTSTRTGKINGVFHTSCFDWISTDGNLTVNSQSVHNDTRRLQAAINAAIGKLVFDEGAYYITKSLQVSPYRTLVGTGRSTFRDPADQYYPFYASISRIVQVTNGEAVFRIGGGVSGVAIRDMALATTVTGSGNTTVGILGTNSYLNSATPPVETVTADSSALSTDFEFTNLTFDGFDKGIYVNAKEFVPNPPDPPEYGAEGVWRFDNVKLDHVQFHVCRIAVHVNSKNSGWSMKNLLLEVPAGSQIPEPVYTPATETTPATYSGGITAANVGSVSVGLYLERIGYSTIDLVIGDGPKTDPPTSASAFIYVGHHANLNIQSSIDEGFKNSVYVYGGDINSPIAMTNNTFQSPLLVRNTTVVSTANQFTFIDDSTISPATAVQNSRIYSIGDRFCLDYAFWSSECVETLNGSGINTATYTTDQSSQLMLSSNPYTTAVSSLRFGPLYYQYDILRLSVPEANPVEPEANNIGLLLFNGVQGSGAGGGSTAPGYAGYILRTAGGEVKVNYDGSVTYGTKTYQEIVDNHNVKLYTTVPDGTVVYCSDCLKTTPCSVGRTGGALAKKLGGIWDCD